jgi:hypothetical protein
MPRIPTPLTWKRLNFAVFEPCGMIGRLYAVAVSGSFAIYKSPHANGFTLVHLPSQAKIIDLEMQNCCKDAAEKFAALDLNWWTCIPEEVIGPDLQEMRSIHERLKPSPWGCQRLGKERPVKSTPS